MTHVNPIGEGNRPGSIGLPLPDTDARIMDQEGREELPMGAVGELAIRGPQVMKGYFNNPADYLANLNDDFHLPLLRKADAIVILSGQGAYEAPERSQALSDILNAKGIPHTLDLWGPDVNHDWPWWRKMLPYWLEKLL